MYDNDDSDNGYDDDLDDVWWCKIIMHDDGGDDDCYNFDADDVW
jgi:hypothetical protein